MSHGPLVDSILREEEEKGWNAITGLVGSSATKKEPSHIPDWDNAFMKVPPERPMVSVAVLVKKNGRLLLGKRLKKGTSGEGLYSCPGGHFEHGEEFLEAAGRELKEETDMELVAGEQVGIVNSIYKETNKHYVVIFIGATIVRGEPVNTEPLKCGGWEWSGIHQYANESIMPGIAQMRRLGVIDAMKNTIFIAKDELLDLNSDEIIDVDEVRRYHEKVRAAGWSNQW